MHRPRCRKNAASIVDHDTAISHTTTSEIEGASALALVYSSVFLFYGRGIRIRMESVPFAPASGRTASNSRTVTRRTGCCSSGAISASGARTKRLSARAGCGYGSGVFTVRPFTSNKSRSSRPFGLLLLRSRPKWRSISRSFSSNVSAKSPSAKAAAAFTKWLFSKSHGRRFIQRGTRRYFTDLPKNTECCLDRLSRRSRWRMKVRTKTDISRVYFRWSIVRDIRRNSLRSSLENL